MWGCFFSVCQSVFPPDFVDYISWLCILETKCRVSVETCCGCFINCFLKSLLFFRITRLGLTSENLKHALESVTLPMRVMMHAGKNMLMNTTLSTPSILLWLLIQMTWKKTLDYSVQQETLQRETEDKFWSNPCSSWSPIYLIQCMKSQRILHWYENKLSSDKIFSVTNLNYELLDSKISLIG